MSSTPKRFTSPDKKGDVEAIRPMVELAGMSVDDANPTETSGDEGQSTSDIATLRPLLLRGLCVSIVAPVAVTFLCLLLLRESRYATTRLQDDPYIVAGSAILGAVLGGLDLLAMQNRLADENAIEFRLKLLFGVGLWSLLAVWTVLTAKFWFHILGS